MRSKVQAGPSCPVEIVKDERQVQTQERQRLLLAEVIASGPCGLEDLLDVPQEPGIQAAVQSKRGQGGILHQQALQLVEQSSVVGRFRDLREIGSVAPGCLIGSRLTRGGALCLFRDQKFAGEPQQVPVEVVCIEEVDGPSSDRQRSQYDRFRLGPAGALGQEPAVVARVGSGCGDGGEVDF